ncbi:hypothetical protein L249_3363 [Ophiocordyceps polyrhachis-furcata BCC 54312]|uniref:SGNH hydrolase-type esterase domain-containing protein n=1 Tax=Ophiocordyceps polyrhachis-furcata BCC 54312 TaxID=1330021 RepID=A0A367LM34_9HYPO|nr:hypothetical protein L249_3363 [Ophiocordyceps polyrhachis-furcata BCC 54312]
MQAVLVGDTSDRASNPTTITKNTIKKKGGGRDMAASYPQVVLFGDSLLQHAVDIQLGFSFQAALQSHCNRRLDVVNRGLSGYNTSNALRFLEDIFPPMGEGTPEMKYIIVLFGANDAVLPLPTTSQHVPIDEYTKNLEAIIHHPRIAAHKPKVLLVTPPPINEMKLAELDLAAGHPSVTRNFDTTAAYSERARTVARRAWEMKKKKMMMKKKGGGGGGGGQQHGGEEEEAVAVVLIDLWKALMDRAIAMAPQDQRPGGPWVGSRENGKAGGLESLLPDGLHLGGEGYRILFDLVRPHVGQGWEAVEGDGFVFPGWKEL